MKIDRCPETALDAETAARIGGLLDRVFDGGFGKRGHFLLRHHMRIIAWDGSDLIAHLALGLRVMRLGEHMIDVATIAEVATRPDRRGEGIASALVADATTVSRDAGAQFVLLFGEAGLYRAAGFREVPNTLRRVDMAGRITRAIVEGPSRDLRVLPLGDAAWDDTLPLDLLGPKF